MTCGAKNRFLTFVGDGNGHNSPPQTILAYTHTHMRHFVTFGAGRFCGSATQLGKESAAIVPPFATTTIFGHEDAVKWQGTAATAAG